MILRKGERRGVPSSSLSRSQRIVCPSFATPMAPIMSDEG